ncbi:I78 family peptidase inhibitor [Streptomyces sp. H27-D2]|uniref:I78 family peptidase inhibitor n=1 Tax=Streptomyces sp. H27-D2 TaxID=3046304 RepID=UPI002DBC9918|nr:I78 family peptidase inhibitor [Streptomyces sp. H27-D2]MEC4019592.1 I78 family peptidase inhibitor [Streptomyces sp. H27-D2]
MAPVQNPYEPADEPESYIGLDNEHAERRARERGWTTVRALPPGTIITMEYLGGRLNFEVEDGTVRRCWKG